MTVRPRSADVYPGPGFRVRTDYPDIQRTLIDRLARFDVPDISDRLNRLYSLDSRIRCLNATDQQLAGSVCTVKVFPGDNLMVHKALDVCRPGDVVVIASHGEQSMNAVLGDMICRKARHRGIAGFLVDGLVRDMPAVDEVGLPVFGRGTTAVGPLHRGPGEINYPIACGGVVINPGDVIIADVAGTVVIPHSSVGDILEHLEGREETQKQYVAAVDRGEFSNDWVDAILSESSCPTHGAGANSGG